MKLSTINKSELLLLKSFLVESGSLNKSEINTIKIINLAELIINEFVTNSDFRNHFDATYVTDLVAAYTTKELETIISGIINVSEIREAIKQKLSERIIEISLLDDELEIDEAEEGAGYLNARTKLKDALGNPFTNNADWGGYDVFRVKADNDFTGYFVIINVDDNNLEFLERRFDADGEYDTKIIDVFDFEQVDTLLSFVTDFEFIDAIDEFTNGPAVLQEAPFVAQPEKQTGRVDMYQELLIRKGVDQSFIDTYLLGVDKLTPAEMSDLGYVEDRIDTHLENFDDDDDDNDNNFGYEDLEPDGDNEYNVDYESEGLKKLKKYGMFVDRDVHEELGSGIWISGPATNYNVGKFIINDNNVGDFKYISIDADGNINNLKTVEFEDVDELISFVDNDLSTPEPVEEVVYDFTGTTMLDINKLSASQIRNYGLIGALLNLVYDNYERSDDRDALEDILVKYLDTSKYSNLENIYGNGKDKTIPPALLKQFYNLVKSYNHNLEWVKKYEYVVSQPKAAPELKIKYTAVKKTTYATDKSGIEFTVEINGKKATGFWTPTGGGYNPGGVDINELRLGDPYPIIKIFNGGGSHRSYEISSAPVKKEKQPKDLRFTGEYYDTTPMGQDFIKKIREGLKGSNKTGATLTPEFLKYFNLKIEL